jgi:PhnB protein
MALTAPYLHFMGNCAEALAFYAEIFGTGPADLMRYADAPDSGFDSDLIMHGQIGTPTAPMLMASDFPPHMAGEPQAGSAVMHATDSLAQAEAIFAALSAGGTVTMPFALMFWTAGFGMVKDRFGTHWYISAPMTPPA